MSFKKRGSSKWTDTPHYIMGTSTDTITTLPANIYPTDTTAMVGLKGNTVQNGTPTPDNPVMPQETGERTAQLYFKKIVGGSIRADGNIDVNVAFDCYVAKVEANQQYIGTGFVYAFYTSEPELGSTSYNGQRITSSVGNGFTSPIDGYVAVRHNGDITDAMLNAGSTALPYEPYGYKIPISSANTTTPVYLGEVETTRRIKKLVLDGTENWNEDTSNYYIFINVSGKGNGIPNSTALSTHTESGIVVNNSGTALFFNKSVFVHSSLADFKAFLAQQYAAGTPVIIWYALTEPETAVVNEPLRKIGDYADTVSGITIPTITGANTIDVDTTLKPSEVNVNYHGWHPTQSLHKFNGTSWD